MVDARRRRADAHGRYLAQPHVPSVGQVQHQVLDVAHAVPHLGRAPDLDLEDLLLFEQGADVDARDQGGGGAPDVTGLDAHLLRLGQIDLDLDGRLFLQVLDPHVLGAVDAGEDRADLLGLLLQHFEVLAVDPHGDGILHRREDLLELVLRVGQDTALQAGVPGHDRLDRVDGLVVVGSRIEADPHLGAVGADDLVAVDGPADMGADVAHTRHGPQLLGGPVGDAGHRRQRGAGSAVEADQKIGLLQRRQHRPIQADEAHDRDQRRDVHRDHGGQGALRRR